MFNKKSKSIIMVPYANDINMHTGVNVKSMDSFNIYMKNCCVALLSVKKYNEDSDVALVTNIDVPEPYKKILDDNRVLIIKVPFTTFKFEDDYKWGLAFYKLCALKYVVENMKYDFYAYLDADIYVQSSFSNIWKECVQNILLYDINHGLQVKDYRCFLDEVQTLTNNDEIITHYGGEFFAASYENSKEFISDCYNIFETIASKKFYTHFGDEFILSLTANKHRNKIKNSGSYIFRFWTSSFRLISTSYKYNPITIIHTPDEKEHGIIKIYNYFIRHGRLPSIKKVYRYLHLKHKRCKVVVLEVLGKFVKR
ncbi:MAG: hypothetical protein J6B88_05915 [Clostridia bacterium]|nr:hypothetical protein [Clostridia bacterium]